MILASSGTADAQRAKKRMAAVPTGSPGLWFSDDDYPPDAVHARRAGRVVAELGLDSTGRVVTCRVAQSSDTESLDRRTCELATERGRFAPATDGRGRPIASTYLLPVRWVIPESGPNDELLDVGKPIEVDTVFEWIIGTDGLVESCRLVSGKLDGAPDQCLRWRAGVPWGGRYQENGEPVRVTVRDRFTRRIEPAALPR